jgi:hypothetical protein
VFSGTIETSDEATVGDLLAIVVDARIADCCTHSLEQLLATHIMRRPEWADVLDALEFVARLEADGALPPVDDLWASLRRGCTSAG